MTKYKVTKFNVGFGEVQYSVARQEGNDLIPIRPIRYYKTRKGALRRIKQLKAQG